MGTLAEQVNDGLVVLETDNVIGQPLVRVQFLLQHEDLVVELLLQLFVREVDAELRQTAPPRENSCVGSE